MPETSLPHQENPHQLLSHRKAAIIYEGTQFFCERFFSGSDPSASRMVRTARSIKQSLEETSLTPEAPTESEIRWTNCARTRLEELLEEFQDYLRNHDHPAWAPHSRETHYVRRLGSNPGCSNQTFRPFYQTQPARIAANVLICLIQQTHRLLTRRIHRLEQDLQISRGLMESPDEDHLQAAENRKTHRFMPA